MCYLVDLESIPIKFLGQHVPLLQNGFVIVRKLHHCRCLGMAQHLSHLPFKAFDDSCNLWLRPIPGICKDSYIETFDHTNVPTLIHYRHLHLNQHLSYRLVTEQQVSTNFAYILSRCCQNYFLGLGVTGSYKHTLFLFLCLCTPNPPPIHHEYRISPWHQIGGKMCIQSSKTGRLRKQGGKHYP